MTGWQDAVLMAFDTETTGVDVETDRIVTACVAVGDPKLGTWHPKGWLLRQERPILAEATAIHGVTTDMANQLGSDPAQALADIRDAILAGWRRGWVLVAYNATFDLTILDRELRRHDLAPLDHIGPVIDPLVIDKASDPFRKGSRKLIDVAAHHGIRMGDTAHGAAADAFAAMRLAYIVSAALPYSPNDWQASIDMARQWQADAYREQRRSLARYFRTKKADEETAAQIEADTDWPIKPYQQPQQELIA